MSGHPDDMSAESIARIAEKLGATMPREGTPRMVLPDIEIEDVTLGTEIHCKVHLIWKGRRIRSENYTPGYKLDGLIAAAKQLGFKVTRA